MTFSEVELEQGYIPWQVYFHLYLDDIDLSLKKLWWWVKNCIGQYIGFASDPLLVPLKNNVAYQSLISETIPKPKVTNQT